MNLSMRIVTVVAALGAAVFSQCAAAKPILWFHFNEKAPGQACAPGDQTVVNAVVGAPDLNGTAKELEWDSTATDDSGAHYVSYTIYVR